MFLKVLRLMVGAFISVLCVDPRIEELPIDHQRLMSDRSVPMIRLLYNGVPTLGHYTPICTYSTRCSTINSRCQPTCPGVNPVFLEIFLCRSFSGTPDKLLVPVHEPEESGAYEHTEDFDLGDKGDDGEIPGDDTYVPGTFPLLLLLGATRCAMYKTRCQLD